MKNLTQNWNALKNAKSLTDSAQEITFQRFFIDTRAIEKNQMLKFFRMFDGEIHQNTTTVAVTKHHGTIWKFTLGPAHIIVDGPDFLTLLRQAWDVQHFNFDFVFIT